MGIYFFTTAKCWLSELVITHRLAQKETEKEVKTERQVKEIGLFYLK